MYQYHSNHLPSFFVCVMFLLKKKKERINQMKPNTHYPLLLQK